MRTRLALVFSLPVLLIPAVAFAQTAGPVALPPVSLPIAVTTVVSILLGILNMIAQGSILNFVTVPKTWAGPATIAGTFVTGIASFLATAAQPWTGSTAFYALAFGLFGLFGGSLPAFALHAHTTLPKAMRMAKMAAKILPLALGLGGGIAILEGAAACTPAEQAAWSKVDTIVLNDVEAGKSRAEIVADVAADLGMGSPLVDTIVLDSLNFLIDVGRIVLHLPEAIALRNELAAEKAARDAPPGTHLLRATP